MNDYANRLPQDKRKPGRPTNAEIAARVPPSPVQTVSNPEGAVLVMTQMKCCGMWSIPRKIKDYPDFVYVQCQYCGAMVNHKPATQQVVTTGNA
jgi:hypothetical protein